MALREESSTEGGEGGTEGGGGTEDLHVMVLCKQINE